ncbi:MAG TPA: hypothetical protein VF143_11585 [Candidatus Nanopelagicales bacterium]
MTALLIFTCLFLPLTVLSILSAGRDVLLFHERERTRRSMTLAAMLAGLAAMLAIGMPASWALALVAVGPAASVTGHWIGSGDWMIAAHRVRRLGQ